MFNPGFFWIRGAVQVIQIRVFKIVFCTALFPGILIITGCSPIPLIQSPRIDSKVAISASVKSSGVNNTNYADESVNSKQKFIVNEKIPLFLTLGIRKRVELSGMLFPYLLHGIMWQGNVKVTLFEIGNDNFNNLASAIFFGTTGYTGEHDDVSNYYGGLSFGSIANHRISKFEFILQSSVSKEYSILSEQRGHYTIYWLQPAFGISCKPNRNKIVQVNIGVNYSYPIKSDVFWTHYNYPSEVRYSNSANGGFSFLGALQFNIVR